MDHTTCVELPTGAKMPMFGLGTWQSTDEAVIQAVNTALDCDYKLIDTAFGYGNEAAIGKALKSRFESGKLKREDIFIASKLYIGHMSSRAEVLRACKLSLGRLDIDYLDLYLIHAPYGMKFIDDNTLFPRDENNEPMMANYDLLEVWRGMEDLVDLGLVKAIGVSNCNSKQIDRFRAIAKHPVSNCQVECHAYFNQEKLFNFCKDRGITFTAYSPMGSPTRPNKPGCSPDAASPLDDPTVKELAAKYKKDPGQILIRFLLQRGIAVIPKSSNPQRIRSNIQIFDFEISPEDMEKVMQLDTGKRIFTFSHLALKHPEYPFNEEF